MNTRARIGLEVHVQLGTGRKLFAPCALDLEAGPNARTDPVSLGLPGSLPVLDGEAVVRAVRLALSLSARVATRSLFARKHYFYPDSPRNYQITQYDHPLAIGGELPPGENPGESAVRLQRLHLEEDAGRSRHLPGTSHTAIDLGRAGAPLVELVTEPVLHTPEQAGSFLRRLRHWVRWYGISTADMEKGEMRCDANVSIDPPDGEADARGSRGARVEIKNLNSFRHVVDALAYEIRRQQTCLARGEPVREETRGWDTRARHTVFQRSKEDEADYRYLREPDLPPLLLDPAWIEAEASRLPISPRAARRRLREEFGLDEESVAFLGQRRARYERFLSAVEAGAPARRCAQWWRGDLARSARVRGRAPEEIAPAPTAMAALVRALEEGSLTRDAARALFEEMVDGVLDARSFEARMAAGARESAPQTGAEPVDAWIDAVLRAHPEQVEAYRRGKTGLLGFFVHAVREASRGKADPREVSIRLRTRLDAPDSPRRT